MASNENKERAAIASLLKRKVGRIAVDYEVETKMRDGVVLRADIYRPAAEGYYPALLAANSRNQEEAMSYDPCSFWVQRNRAQHHAALLMRLLPCRMACGFLAIPIAPSC